MTESSPTNPEYEFSPDRASAAAGSPSGGASSPAVDETASSAVDMALAEEDVEAVKQELNVAQDRILRVQAELENFRKRSRRELDDERRYAALPLLRDLLPVQDNLLRAIESAEQSENGLGLLEGVKMVATQFNSILEQHQCRPIQATGAAFDPHLHQAIGQEPTDQFPPQTVTREFSVGYQLHGRVVRPSQVFVATPPLSENSAGSESDPEPQG